MASLIRSKRPKKSFVLSNVLDKPGLGVAQAVWSVKKDAGVVGIYRQPLNNEGPEPVIGMPLALFASLLVHCWSDRPSEVGIRFGSADDKAEAEA